MRAFVSALLLAAGLVVPGPARADELLPRAAELTGARSLALGDAFRSVGTGNETIYLNPAGLETSPRYQLEAQGSRDFGPPTTTFGFSVADSESSPIGAGLAYNRFISGPEGSRTVASIFHLALAYPLGENAAIGVTGKWLHLADVIKHNAVTPDVGLLLHFAPVSLALVAYNLVDVKSLEAPRQLAVAASVGSDSSFRLTVDVVGDFATRVNAAFAYHVGAEYLVLPYLVLRAGYVEDRIRMAHLASGGLGLFFPPGVGIDLAYRHEIGGTVQTRQIALGLKVQL